MKQEWRVKEKADTPAPTTFNDDMDLLDDDESPLIKDGSPPPTGMDRVQGCRPSSGVPRRRSLRCVSALKRPCSRSPKSRPALEVVVRSGSHRQKADLQDARRCWCHRKPNAVLRLQEA
jgi:hypothetical protein